jgi:tetratricopeptide (TPR) repeat protein
MRHSLSLFLLMLCASPVMAGSFEDGMAIVKDPVALSTKAAEAKRLFQKTVADNPKHVNAWYNLGLLAMKAGNQEVARENWSQALKVDPGFLAAQARIAESDLTNKSLNGRAIIALNAIIEKEPFQPEARNALTALALEVRDWEQALTHARNVLLGDPSNANAYLNIAVAYYRQRQYDQAFLILKQAMERVPKAASLHNITGLIYLQRDNSRLASESFLRAIKYDPTQLDALINLASLELSYGDFEAAEKRFKRVLESRPDDVRIIMSYAVVQRGLGRFEEAQKGYERVLELKPDSRNVHYNLCVLHYQFTNNYTAAQTSCNTYFRSIRRGHPKFREMRRRMRSIKELLKAAAEEKAEAAKCQKACEGKACGDDGCGGECGTCPEGEMCSEEGACAAK